MKTIAVFCLALLPAAAFAQQPKAANISCVQPAPQAATEAEKLLATGDFAGAEKLYAGQLAGATAEAGYQGLLRAQVGQNHVKQASETAKSAAAAAPNAAWAQVLLGDAELRAGHIDEAVMAYTSARKLDFCNAKAHAGFARTSQLFRMDASAQKELAIAHKLALADEEISEAYFATLPPALHAKGFRNLLASSKTLTTEHRARLEEQATALEVGDTCQPIALAPGTKLNLQSVFSDAIRVRDRSLQVAFGDGKKLNLELDGSASGIVLSQADADKVGVVPLIAQVDRTKPYLGSIETITIGAAKFARCTVRVVPRNLLAPPNGLAYSVIGLDFFRDSMIHIDWAAKEMTLTPFALSAAPLDAVVPDAEKTWAHVVIDGPRVLFPLAIYKQPRGLALFTPGFMPVVASPELGATLGASKDESAGFQGIDGELLRVFYKDGPTGTVNDLRYADGTLVNVQRIGKVLEYRFANYIHAVYNGYAWDLAPLSHGAGVEISSVFGYQLAQQYFIDIDYRNGLVQMVYDVSYGSRPHL